MSLKYDLNKRVSCFGNKCSGMRICDCLLDVTLGTLKDMETIPHLWRFYEEKNTGGLNNLFLDLS